MPCGIYFRIGVPRMYAAEILRRAAKPHTPSPRAVFHRIHTRPDPGNHTGRCPMTACAAGPSLPAPHTQLGLSPLASQPDGGRRRQVTPRPSARGARKTRILFKTAQGPVPGPCGKGWTRLYSTGAPCLYSLHILLAAARRSHVTRQAARGAKQSVPLRIRPVRLCSAAARLRMRLCPRVRFPDCAPVSVRIRKAVCPRAFVQAAYPQRPASGAPFSSVFARISARFQAYARRARPVNRCFRASFCPQRTARPAIPSREPSHITASPARPKHKIHCN